jgi:hypothetical protein
VIGSSWFEHDQLVKGSNPCPSSLGHRIVACLGIGFRGVHFVGVHHGRSGAVFERIERRGWRFDLTL